MRKRSIWLEKFFYVVLCFVAFVRVASSNFLVHVCVWPSRQLYVFDDFTHRKLTNTDFIRYACHLARVSNYRCAQLVRVLDAPFFLFLSTFSVEQHIFDPIATCRIFFFVCLWLFEMVKIWKLSKTLPKRKCMLRAWKWKWYSLNDCICSFFFSVLNTNNRLRMTLLGVHDGDNSKMLTYSTTKCYCYCCCCGKIEEFHHPVIRCCHRISISLKLSMIFWII